MKIISKSILLPALLLGTFSSLAQTPVVIDGRSSNNRGWLGGGMIRDFLSNNVDNPLNEHVLKFNPLQVFRGELGLTLENTLSERTTYSLMLGPTISNLSPVSSGHSFPASEVGFQVSPQYSVSSKVGIMIGSSFRFYPMNDDAATNGFFVEPSFKYRRFNENIFDRNEILEDQNGHTNQFRFAFNVGSQRWYSNQFSLEYYIGAGINYQTESTYRVFSEFDFNTGEVSHSWVGSNINDALWYISGGINIGIGW